MENFPVLFYDGYSSTGYEAFLHLSADCWVIHYQDQNQQVQSVNWMLSLVRKVEIIQNITTFRYGSFPQQAIECSNLDFVTLLKTHYPHADFLKSNSLELRGWKNIVIAVLLLIALLATVYIYVIPSAAEFIAGKIPQEIETDIGDSMLNSFTIGSEKDAKLTFYLNLFAGKINFNTSYPIEITVVKSEQVNAFALPGGKIVVNDAILKKINSPEELAGLLSHEAAHIEYKHSLKSISKSLSGYIFISLIFNDINGITTVLIDNANALNNLRYSRSLEADADLRALQTMEKNRISQQGLVSLFTMLDSKDGFNYLKFLSTHPLTEERIRKARKSAQNQKKISEKKDLELIWQQIKNQLDKKSD
ncbi:MAG: M48 family metallopeptidase [Pyrinomonadaceae bacterium]|nr:M48 family metallopeptidase [Sphingobacteriaceae bacterium]